VVAAWCIGKRVQSVTDHGSVWWQRGAVGKRVQSVTDHGSVWWQRGQWVSVCSQSLIMVVCGGSVVHW